MSSFTGCSLENSVSKCLLPGGQVRAAEVTTCVLGEWSMLVISPASQTSLCESDMRLIVLFCSQRKSAKAAVIGRKIQSHGVLSHIRGEMKLGKESEDQSYISLNWFSKCALQQIVLQKRQKRSINSSSAQTEVHGLHHMFNLYLTIAKSVYIKKGPAMSPRDFHCHLTQCGGLFWAPAVLKVCVFSSCPEFLWVFRFASSAMDEKTVLKLFIGWNGSVSESLSTCIRPVMDMRPVQEVNLASCPLCASPTPGSWREINAYEKEWWLINLWNHILLWFEFFLSWLTASVYMYFDSWGEEVE